jgi:hypothetical protein
MGNFWTNFFTFPRKNFAECMSFQLHLIIIRTKTVNRHSNDLKKCSYILQNLPFESSEVAVSISPSYCIERKHVPESKFEDLSSSNSVHESNISIYIYKTLPNKEAFQFCLKIHAETVDKVMLPDGCDVDTTVPA